MQLTKKQIARICKLTGYNDLRKFLENSDKYALYTLEQSRWEATKKILRNCYKYNTGYMNRFCDINLHDIPKSERNTPAKFLKLIKNKRLMVDSILCDNNIQHFLDIRGSNVDLKKVDDDLYIFKVRR